MVDDALIQHAASALRNGGTVVFPTETVYGLGASARNAEGASRIFEIKGRPRFNPLIVHVLGLEALEGVAGEIPDTAKRLANAFWPGPLTLVLPKHSSIPEIVTAGLDSVAVRAPCHPIARQLLHVSRVPIAAPSANAFGALSPTAVSHLDPRISAQVDAVLDGGPCEIGVESTIVSFLEAEPVLLRAGGLSLETIESVVGTLRAHRPGSSPLAPGMLPRHYAPATPLVLDGIGVPRGPRVGLLALGLPNDREAFGAFFSLSETGNLREAAHNLFSGMRQLEHSGLDTIVARLVPAEGLGVAINDRLTRASQ